jgi:TPR repeat protein
MSKVSVRTHHVFWGCIFLLNLSLAGCASDAADELAQGMRLLRAESGLAVDAPRAVKHLQRAAEQKSASAAYHLGLLYRRGATGATGLAADPVKAMRWLRVAAQADLPQAQFMLGQMLLAGEGGEGGVAQPLEARAWFEKAAEHDLAEANLELAMAYRRGDLGVKPDSEVADRYFMEAQHALKHRPVDP